MTTPDPMTHLHAIAAAYAALVRAEADPLPPGQEPRRGLIAQDARAALNRCMQAARAAFPGLEKPSSVKVGRFPP